MITQNPSSLLKKKDEQGNPNTRNLAEAVKSAKPQKKKPEQQSGYFDLDKARQDKVPDEAIAKNLAGRVGFDVEAARKDNVPWDVIADTVASKYNEGKSKGWKVSDLKPNRSPLGYARDLAVSGVQGFAGIGPNLIGLLDIATATSPANLVPWIKSKIKGEKYKSPITPTKFLQKYTGYSPGSVSDALQKLKTKEAQEIAKEVGGAENIPELLQSIARNPSIVATDIARFLPQMWGGGALTKTLGFGPALTGALNEAWSQAGSMATELQEKGDLTAGKALMATASGAIDALISRISSRIAKRLGVNDIDVLFGGGKAAKVAKNRITKALAGAFQEGVGEEFTQGA